MVRSITRFLRDETGLETVEWALVGGLVVAIGAAIFVLIGQDAERGLQNLQTETALIP